MLLYYGPLGLLRLKVFSFKGVLIFFRYNITILIKGNCMTKKLTTTAESEYATNKKNVIITCPIHGNFEQTPARHPLLGSGCKQCAIESVKEILRIKNANNTILSYI